MYVNLYIYIHKNVHIHTHTNIRAHTYEKENNPIQSNPSSINFKCEQVGKQAYNYISLHLIGFIQIIDTLKTKIETYYS